MFLYSLQAKPDDEIDPLIQRTFVRCYSDLKDTIGFVIAARIDW
jgi:hypothetical protein